MSSSHPPQPRIQRRKHTQPPPDNVCCGCWWERKYKHLESIHKQTRIMMLKLVNNKRKSEDLACYHGCADDDDDDSQGGNIMDLVDVFQRGRDD